MTSHVDLPAALKFERKSGNPLMDDYVVLNLD